MKQLLLDFTPPPERTFANFVVGANAELVLRLKALCRLQAAVDGPALVYIWGAPGSGKSHLLAAVAATTEWPLLRVTSNTQSIPESRSVVVVDDVQNLAPHAQQALFNLINSRHYAAVVATGNAAPMHLAMREDLTTRLGSGLVFQLRTLADSEKAAALAAHAKSRGFELRADVAEYLVSHFARDMSSLVCVLDQLDQYSLESQRPVTLPLVRAAVHGAST